MKSTIKKYLSGKSSVNEQKILLQWIKEDHNFHNFQTIKKKWKEEILKEDIPGEFLPNWQNIQNRLFEQMQIKMNRAQRNLNFMSYAAIFVIFILIPSLLYLLSQPKLSVEKNYTTVSADFGQISKVILPDSSIIWVNSGSTIRYNNQYPTTNRNIKLIGEAFFKVHKNKTMPFIVSSSKLSIKALGTEFCVSAYPKESSIQVILEKGSVRLTSLSLSHLSQEMKPGEMTDFDKEKNHFALSEVNTKLFTSWKDGIIHLYNLPLCKVVFKLEKRYNQHFIIDDSIKDIPYTFTIKDEKLNDILNLIEKITPIMAIQKGNVIELKRKNV